MIRGLPIALDGAAPAGVADDVQNGGVNVGVTERLAFLGRDFADPANQIFIPRGSDANLGGEVACVAVANSTDAFVGEIDRNPETGFFDEPALNDVEEIGVFGVAGHIVGAADAVAVLVDIADAIFPNFTFPFFGRVGVLENAVVAVNGAHLRGFLIHVHLAEEIGDTLVGGETRIFVGVLFAVLVSVDPTFVVDVFAGLPERDGDEESAAEEGEDGFFHSEEIACGEDGRMGERPAAITFFGFFR